MLENINAIDLAHCFIKSRVKAGDFCVDATAGNGNDTLMLSQLVGDSGKVLAFDVQQAALASTRELLNNSSATGEVELVLDGHENMGNYAKQGTVDCIVFNLGWLPGGNHGVFTRPDTTIQAIESGLELLKVGGTMSICIYYGRDTGFKELDALRNYLPTIDFKRFTVLMTEFLNRPNNPPIPVFITRDK